MKCPKCKGDMDQIYDPIERITRGWYCVPCDHFEKAIGREKKIPLGGSDEATERQTTTGV